MTTAAFADALGDVGTQLSGYVPAILTLVTLVIGIKVGIKWLRSYGKSAA